MKIKSIFLTLLFSILSTNVFAAPTTEGDIYPYRMTSINKNEMQIINSGIGALYARLDMIRRATSTLDLEYFIFNPDSTGRIVIKELIKASQRGVKVRILVDKSVAVFRLDEYYAKVLKDHNIELRYYNPASTFRISSVQFRNHRKLILRDGVEAITGGRNIADEYFDLSKTFNFLDRDIWVEGELTRAMKDTFELYWKSDIVETPKAPEVPVKRKSINPEDDEFNDYLYRRDLDAHLKKTRDAEEFIAENYEDDIKLEFALNYGKKTLASTNKYVCPEASFATDKEGASFVQRLKSKDYNQNYRLLRKEIAEWMEKVEDEIILDSPYFLNDKNSHKIIKDLLSNNKKITILTNSLASTDAVYVSTVFNDTVKRYTPLSSFNAYVYKGTFSNESDLISEDVKNAEWGTHSKTILYSDDSFMVGTFNIDNRSNFYNTEMAVFCSGSPELAKDVLDNVKVRMKNSHHLNKFGKPDDGTDLLAGTTLKKRIIYYMLKFPATLFQFLL